MIDEDIKLFEEITDYVVVCESPLEVENKDATAFASMLTYLSINISTALKERKRKIKEVKEDPGIFDNYPMLKENIFSVSDFLRTQDLEGYIKNTKNPEKGIIALRFIQDRLQAIIRRGLEVSSDENRRGYEIKACKAVELLLNETKVDPQKYRDSDNPITVVISIWNDVDQVLTSIIEELDKKGK